MVRRARLWVAATAVGLAGVAAVATAARAQDAGPGGPARGLSVWVRAGGGSAAELTGSALGAPQFGIGARGGALTFGVGLGVSRVTVSSESEYGGGDRSSSETRATVVQLGPEIMADVWRSADGRTRGSVAGGVSFGRASVTERDEDTFSGSTTVSETKSSGSALTVRVGLGGEHWLHRNFALGFEAGLRFTSLIDVKQEGSTSQDGLGAAGSYAALRAQVVFGR